MNGYYHNNNKDVVFLQKKNKKTNDALKSIIYYSKYLQSDNKLKKGG
jgi:hypothetical protein